MTIHRQDIQTMYLTEKAMAMETLARLYPDGNVPLEALVILPIAPEWHNYKLFKRTHKTRKGSD